MHVSVDKVLNDFLYQHAFVKLRWVLCTATETLPKGSQECYFSYQKNKFTQRTRK